MTYFFPLLHEAVMDLIEAWMIHGGGRFALTVASLGMILSAGQKT